MHLLLFHFHVSSTYLPPLWGLHSTPPLHSSTLLYQTHTLRAAKEEQRQRLEEERWRAWQEREERKLEEGRARIRAGVAGHFYVACTSEHLWTLQLPEGVRLSEREWQQAVAAAAEACRWGLMVVENSTQAAGDGCLHANMHACTLGDTPAVAACEDMVMQQHYQAASSTGAEARDNNIHRRTVLHHD